MLMSHVVLDVALDVACRSLYVSMSHSSHISPPMLNLRLQALRYHSRYPRYPHALDTASFKPTAASFLNNPSFGTVVRAGPTAVSDSPFRNPDGSFIKGSNAEEARLHDRTLLGRMNHSPAKLPSEIAKAINNNILRLSSPGRLRTKASQIYQALNKEQLQTAPTTALDANAHIAALFLQDYGHCYQVLHELQQRSDDFNPKKVLTVGYGPATGMVALNEIMGDDFRPEVKDAYVVGRSNKEMKKRAKIILSRQLCEQPYETEELDKLNVDGQVSASTKSEPINEKEAVLEHKVEEEELDEIAEEEQDELIEEEQDVPLSDYVGPVDTSRINIVTRLLDTLPTSKKYDLIVVNHALLTKEHHFPRDVDINISMLLKLLSPEGHIVLVERGNSVGFETIARARQLMIRPESYEKEIGKVPRPYIKGSSIKPQKLRHVDQMITEEHVKQEEKMLAEIEKELAEEEMSEEEYQLYLEQAQADESNGAETDLEREIINKHGQVSAEELKFEFEDNKDFEFIDPTEQDVSTELSSESVDFHLLIIAPCSHHSKCPLQLGDPKYYKIPSHKHRLNFCSFDKVMERPKYTMELKKGKKLASAWDKTAEDGFGFDRKKKGELKKLAGSGRPGGNNTENGSYSYLIAKRSKNDVETIKAIEKEREFNNYLKLEDNPMNWPRILEVPSRVKNNVKLTTCAPSGNIEVWQVPKSLGKQEYHDARKVERGDLWGLGKKTVLVKNQLSDKVKDKLDVLSKTQKKTFIKEQRKKVWKKLISQSEAEFDNDIVALSDSIASNLEASRKYKLKGKRGKYDVDLEAYDGR